ncbi:MAG: HNH endonuclease [Gammaproteobacteria bacterium]|nr:HNH endonuclease [Gammaproteobacteria bacterium]
MNDQELLDRVENIKVWQQYDVRAPHKPLLLLYALGRVQSGMDRLVAYSEVEPMLQDLLEQFGPPRKSYHPDQPFKRLPRDKLWELEYPMELVGRPSDSLKPAEMRNLEVSGGFPREIHDYLATRTELVHTLATKLLSENFPVTYHDEIRRILGLDARKEVSTTKKHARDPLFRENVLRAYGRECCVCGSNLRLDNALFDLEAAHIMWHSHGGPDQIQNGLALCGFHHKAFDRGAWGLSDSDYAIQVSSELNGSSRAMDLLLNFEGENLQLPRKSSHYPNTEFVRWHRKEVFRNEVS